MSFRDLIREACEAFVAEISEIMIESMNDAVTEGLSTEEEPAKPVRLATLTTGTSESKAVSSLSAEDRRRQILKLLHKGHNGATMGHLREATGESRHNLRTTLLSLMKQGKVRATVGASGHTYFLV